MNATKKSNKASSVQRIFPQFIFSILPKCLYASYSYTSQTQEEKLQYKQCYR
jgi:hypothetical protein